MAIAHNQITDSEAVGKLCLWFFRDLTDDHRNALFALFGLPLTEINTHGMQTKCLQHVVSAIKTPPANSRLRGIDK